jgi:hypothetical protein
MWKSIWGILTREIRFAVKDEHLTKRVTTLEEVFHSWEEEYQQDWKAIDRRIDPLESYLRLLATIDDRLRPLEQNYGFLLNNHELTGRDINLIRASRAHKDEILDAWQENAIKRIDRVEAAAAQNTRLLKEVVKLINEARNQKQ